MCMYVCICCVGVYSGVRGHIRMHFLVHVYRGQSLTLNVSLDDSLPYLLRQDISLNMELLYSVRLAGQ